MPRLRTDTSPTGGDDGGVAQADTGRPWRRSAALLMLAAVLSALAYLHIGPVTSAVGLGIALTLPGLACSWALLDDELTRSSMFMLSLSVVLSAGLYILLALTLNAVGLRLSRTAFVIGTDAVVTLACAYSLITNRRPVATVRLGRPRAASLVPAGAIAVAAGVVVVMANVLGATPQPYEALYASGGPAAAGQPVAVRHDRATVQIAAVNGTRSTQDYVISAVPGHSARWPEKRVTITAGQTWRGSISGPVPRPSCDDRLTIRLRELRTSRTLTVLSIQLTRGRRGLGLVC